MKKFLFTLAALFVAGSSFASNEYFFVSDVTLTEGQTTVQVDVMAHLEAMINAFTVDFGTGVDDAFQSNVLPGGLTITSYNVKQTSARINYQYWDSDAEELVDDTCVPSIGVSQANTRFIGMTSAMDSEWAEIDGVPTNCGAIKWKPGEFRMFRVTFTIPENYTTQTVSIRTQPACGNDPRGNVTDGVVRYSTFQIIAAAAPVVPDAPEPVITFTPDANGVAISVAPCTSYEVIVNDVNMGQIDYVAAEYDVTKEIVVNATNAPADYNPATATDSYTLDPKPYAPAVNPVITFTPVEGGVNIAVDPYTSYEVIVNDVNMGQITFVAEEYDVTKVIVVNAVNEPEHQLKGEATDTYTLDPKAYDPAVNPTITFEPVEGGVNIVVTDYTSYEVIVNGVNKGQIDYVAQAEENQHIVVNAVNEPAHQEVGSATAEYDLVGTGGSQEQCLNPNAGYHITGFELATVTITNREPGATVYYEVFKKNDLGEWEKIDEGNFTGETYSFPVEGDGSYRVECVAKLQGKLDSDPGALEFVIHEGETTAVDELMNGKAIAGVRYFNMAGQEMQEANGMTIVVTTYTDGTTSAVKVMK